MGKEGKILQYRDRLDKTLASPELTNKDSVKTLVRNQLLSSKSGNEECSEMSLEKKTDEVLNFLDMLRSASVKNHQVSGISEASDDDWKLFQDNEELRVMYRQGIPFNTLLVEGYIDGPVDVSLCIAWEPALYKKWWPQSVFPSFKIMIGECLQKNRIGEQIALVRMKVPWPLSTREAVVHFELFEYFQDELVIVLMKTVSRSDNTAEVDHQSSNGEAQDVVNIDLVGGFAIQKVTSERSYIRTIAMVDIKVDFIPPYLMNFISRQLVGNGFLLYKKIIASVSKHNEYYAEALRDPMYARLRKALDSIDDLDDSQNKKTIINESEEVKIMHDLNSGAQPKLNELQTLDVKPKFHDSSPNKKPDTHKKVFGEIEEEESEDHELDKVEDNKTTAVSLNDARIFCLSPQVIQALGTLEKVISVVRKHGVDSPSTSSSSIKDEEEPPNSGKFVVEDSAFKENTSLSINSKKVLIEVPRNEVVERDLCDRQGRSSNYGRNSGSSSFAKEASNNRIAPSPPRQVLEVPSAPKGADELSFLDQSIEDDNKQTTTTEDKKLKRNKKQHWFCCFNKGYYK